MKVVVGLVILVLTIVLIPFRVLTFFRPIHMPRWACRLLLEVLIPFRVLTFFRPMTVADAVAGATSVLIPFRVLTFFRLQHAHGFAPDLKQHLF